MERRCSSSRQSHQVAVEWADWEKAVWKIPVPAVWCYSQGRHSLPHYNPATVITNLRLISWMTCLKMHASTRTRLTDDAKKKKTHIDTSPNFSWHVARWLAVIFALGWGGTHGDKSIQIARSSRVDLKESISHRIPSERTHHNIVALLVARCSPCGVKPGRQKISWPLEQCTVSDLLSKTRCVMMTFLAWLTSQTSSSLHISVGRNTVSQQGPVAPSLPLYPRDLQCGACLGFPLLWNIIPELPLVIYMISIRRDLGTLATRQVKYISDTP